MERRCVHIPWIVFIPARLLKVFPCISHSEIVPCTAKGPNRYGYSAQPAARIIFRITVSPQGLSRGETELPLLLRHQLVIITINSLFITIDSLYYQQ